MGSFYCCLRQYRLWTLLLVLYGQFVLLFEIIPSVESINGTVWVVCIVEIIPSVNRTVGTLWAVCIFV